MRQPLVHLCAFLLWISQVLAEDAFMVATPDGHILHQEGDCQTQYSPCSTFKIALALMGYDAGILEDEIRPLWPFKQGYMDALERWRQAHYPQLWMQNSCVWYSQVLTQRMGMERFQAYVTAFEYGNQDVSGDKGKANGLTRAWLSSSLKISPQEQLTFLSKLLKGAFPAKPHAHDMTRKILFVEDLPGGWKLYGKTGNGPLLGDDGAKKLDLQHGWFVGWVEKKDSIIIFVKHLVDTKKEQT